MAKKDPFAFLDEPTCDHCGVAPAAERHSCPYNEEMNGNYDDDYCNCCPACVRDCLMDI